MAVIHFPKSITIYLSHRAKLHSDEAKRYEAAMENWKNDPTAYEALKKAKEEADKMAKMLGHTAMQHKAKWD